MFELEIGLIDGDKLNFDKSFLHFNVKKKKNTQSDNLKEQFYCKYWIVDTADLNSSFIASYSDAHFPFHIGIFKGEE